MVFQNYLIFQSTWIVFQYILGYFQSIEMYNDGILRYFKVFESITMAF
jgi:hypothetical protein